MGNPSLGTRKDRQDARAGIAWMVAAFGAFSVMLAATKLLATHYPPLELASLRGMASLPLIGAWTLLAGGPKQLFRVRWRLQAVRGVLTIATVAAISLAFRQLPLATASSISFAAPLLVGAFSVPILGERLDTKGWLAVLIGFLGVLIVLRPGRGSLVTLGGLAALLSTVSYALSAVVTRILSRSDSALSMAFWTVAILAFGSGALASSNWVPTRFDDWPPLLAIGITGAFGQYAFSRSLQCAPAPTVAPFEYTALVWAVSLDWLLWQTPPDTQTLLGAGVIIAAGVQLLMCTKSAQSLAAQRSGAD